MSMSLGPTERLAPLLDAVRAMVRDEIAPLDAEFLAQVAVGDRRLTPLLAGEIRSAYLMSEPHVSIPTPRTSRRAAWRRATTSC